MASCCSAAGKLPGRLTPPLREDRKHGKEAVEVRRHGAAVAPDRRPEQEIFHHRQAGENVPAFRNERDALGDHVLKRDSAERSAGEDHGARSRSDDPGHGQDERGLAGAVRADDAHDLAFVDLQVDFADGGDGAVAHDESGDGEKRHARAHCSASGPR
jgi:hypothetical protein